MHYYYIRNYRTGNSRGAYGDTFGDACRALGWDFRECSLIKFYN